MKADEADDSVNELVLMVVPFLPPAQMPPRRFPVAFCRSPQMPAGTIAGPPIAGRLQNGHFQSHDNEIDCNFGELLVKLCLKHRTY